MKFKELDAKKNCPWIMLINSIKPENLTFFEYWYVRIFPKYTPTVVAWLSSVLILKCLVNSNKERNFYSLLLC